MIAPKTGIQIRELIRVTISAPCPMPPRSAAMLITFAITSSAQAPHSTHRG